MIGQRNKALSVAIFLILLFLAIKKAGGAVGMLNLLDVIVTLFIYLVIFNVGVIITKNIQKNIND